jgi:hypothetical protein
MLPLSLEMRTLQQAVQRITVHEMIRIKLLDVMHNLNSHVEEKKNVPHHT